MEVLINGEFLKNFPSNEEDWFLYFEFYNFASDDYSFWYLNELQNAFIDFFTLHSQLICAGNGECDTGILQC